MYCCLAFPTRLAELPTRTHPRARVRYVAGSRAVFLSGDISRMVTRWCARVRQSRALGKRPTPVTDPIVCVLFLLVVLVLVVPVFFSFVIVWVHAAHDSWRRRRRWGGAHYDAWLVLHHVQRRCSAEFYSQPEWSAFRNGTVYGSGRLAIRSSSLALWEWKVSKAGGRARGGTGTNCTGLLGLACFKRTACVWLVPIVER